MKSNYANEMKKALLASKPDYVPEGVLKLFVDMLPLVRRQIIRKFMPAGVSREDREDAESEALTTGFDYILNFCKKYPNQAKNRDEAEWRKKIYNRFSNAVFEYGKYITLPIVVPRPIRLSLNKFKEVERIIHTYESKMDSSFVSDLYECVLVNGCVPDSKCKDCKLSYDQCPVDRLSPWDKKLMTQLLVHETGSIRAYGLNYRKPYQEWLGLLRAVRNYKTTHLFSEAVTYDFDRLVTFSDLKEQMDQIDPRLFPVYCMSFYVVDLDVLGDTGSIQTPRGWISKEICELFDLQLEEYKDILVSGDEILNNFREHEGLPAIQRGIH
jgi:hypothetical protein